MAAHPSPLPFLLLLSPSISCYTPQITSLQSFFSHLALAAGQHQEPEKPAKRSPFLTEGTSTQDPRIGRAISLFATSISSSNIHMELYDKFKLKDPPPQTTPAATTTHDILLETESGEEKAVKEDNLIENTVKCTHKMVEQCHYTFKTYFKAIQEKICHINYEKLCKISFSSQASKEKVRKCHHTVSKDCKGDGPKLCQTSYETVCSNRYKDNVTLTSECKKLPVEICGKGCEVVEGPEECYEEQNDVIVDIPEETCDLNPWKQCGLVTRFVPSLKPSKECTNVPLEVCNLEYGDKRKIQDVVKVTNIPKKDN